ncbi:unnamed protein product [Hermetia illucens]|uniref:Uncharacterized protein n=1 Tax=Hermetia illucens TaxID=343691 RepID=A0A7R8UUL8_HERIL|nr:unnamed protein product [Hermetia illucens]
MYSHEEGALTEGHASMKGHRLRANTAPSQLTRPRNGALNSLIQETFKITTSQFKFERRPPPVFLDSVQSFHGHFEDGAADYIG